MKMTGATHALLCAASLRGAFCSPPAAGIGGDDLADGNRKALLAVCASCCGARARLCVRIAVSCRRTASLPHAAWRLIQYHIAKFLVSLGAAESKQPDAVVTSEYVDKMIVRASPLPQPKHPLRPAATSSCTHTATPASMLRTAAVLTCAPRAGRVGQRARAAAACARGGAEETAAVRIRPRAVRTAQVFRRRGAEQLPVLPASDLGARAARCRLEPGATRRARQPATHHALARAGQHRCRRRAQALECAVRSSAQQRKRAE
jgi:hypothetical protein